MAKSFDKCLEDLRQALADLAVLEAEFDTSVKQTEAEPNDNDLTAQGTKSEATKTHEEDFTAPPKSEATQTNEEDFTAPPKSEATQTPEKDFTAQAECEVRQNNEGMYCVNPCNPAKRRRLN